MGNRLSLYKADRSSIDATHNCRTRLASGGRGVPAPCDIPSEDSGLLLATKSLDMGVSTPRPSSATPNFSTRASILGVQLMEIVP
eukprot:jgi/Botrbrau1/11604/Bobra.247_1s0018.1